MLDVLTFMLALLLMTTILATILTLVITSFVYVDRIEVQGQRDASINSAVTSANSIVELILAPIVGVIQYFATHIAFTVMLALGLLLFATMQNSEDKFLRAAAPVYHDVNAVWVNAFIEPLAGVVHVAYGAVVPIANVITMVLREILHATITVLGDSAQDPFVILKSLLSVPEAIGKLATAAASTVTDNIDEGGWLVNHWDVRPAVEHLQVNLVKVVADQAYFLCRAVVPVVAVSRDVLVSDHLRNLIYSVVNTPWRAVQAIIKIVVPAFGHPDVEPLFDELRSLLIHGGAVLDDLLQAALNLGIMPVDSLGKVALPRPSAGEGLARAAAAAVSLVEIPFKMTIAALTKASVYEASDLSPAMRQAHLGVLQSVAAVNAIKTLVETGKVGKNTRMTCRYFSYNFFAGENIKDSIPDRCMCQTHDHCGPNGMCTDAGLCQCQVGYINIIPSKTGAPSPFRCVPDCSSDELKGDFVRQCGAPFGNATSILSAGTCQDDGRCLCDIPGAVVDLHTGKCVQNITIPASRQHKAEVQKATHAWADARCDGVVAHELGPAFECAMQSSLLATVGAVYTGYEFVRQIIFRFPSVFNDFHLFVQTFDGMWYPRMDSVSCEYRRDVSAAYDRTIHPRNCMCDPPEAGQDPNLLTYDPYCGQPTLNANVYSHMDAFAFYGGRKLPIQGVAGGNYIFVGGTGAQFGFLSDTIGVYVTTAARASIETMRVATHILAGITSYVLAIGKLFSGGSRYDNYLHLPQNCEWGERFRGPVRPIDFTPDQRADVIEQFEFIRTQCRDADCSYELNVQIDEVSTLLPADEAEWGTYTKAQANDLLNKARAVKIIYKRNHDVRLTSCVEQRYERKHHMACTNNTHADCTCSPKIDFTPGDKCRCLPLYPFIEATKQDMNATYKSDFLAKYYSQQVPWCNTMLLEHAYFWKLSAAIGLQNLIARFAGGSPLSSEIQSQCFDSTKTYQLSTTNSLTRLFQPNPAQSGYVFVGAAGGSVYNTTICETLKKMDEMRWIKDNDIGGVDFRSPGYCMSSSVRDMHKIKWSYEKDGVTQDCYEGPPELRKLALTDFTNPYVDKAELHCYHTGSTADQVQAIKAAFAKGIDVCSKIDYGTGKLTTTGLPTHMPETNWVSIDQYRANVKGYKIETETHKLHPKTCGFLTQNDHLVFQPCRYQCLTDGGHNTCWCNVTVHHDIRCNIAELLRKNAWGGIEADRQLTTTVISLFALLPEGVRQENVPLMCEDYRFHGSQAAVMASLLTMPAQGSVGEILRERIARLGFAIWESAKVNGIESMKELGSAVAAEVESMKAAKAAGVGGIPRLEDVTMALPRYAWKMIKGSKGIDGTAMQTVVHDALRNLWPQDPNKKVCLGGKRWCESCDTPEDCEDTANRECIEDGLHEPGNARCTGEPMIGGLLLAAEPLTYCYSAGKCPSDPWGKAEGEYYGVETTDPVTRASVMVQRCCTNDCEKDRSCATSHVCSYRNITLVGAGRNNWCRPDYAEPSEDAKRCHEWPRFSRSRTECFHPHAKCVDKRNCKQLVCTAAQKACAPQAASLGKLIVTVMFKDIMYRAVNYCTIFDALKKVVFSTSLNGAGVELISGVQDVINTVFETLDRSFANLIILFVQVVGGFVGAVTHPSNTRLWGAWVKSILHFITAALTLIFEKGMDVIMIIFTALPDPLGEALQMVLGGLCTGIHYAFGGIFWTLNRIPGVSSITPDIDWLEPDPKERCMMMDTSEHSSTLIQADHARRRLHGRPLDEAGLNETEFHYFRERVDWSGDTTCARIGRNDEPPETKIGFEIWRTCLINRQHVAVIRAVTNHSDVPWTVLDDWVEPVKFGAKLTHGIAIYLTGGEGELRKWKKYGYPVEASISVVQRIDGWTLPKAPLEMALDFVPQYWPDYLHNKDGVGHNIYAVLSNLNRARYTPIKTSPAAWSDLHHSIHSVAAEMARGVSLPKMTTVAPRPPPPMPPTPRRRLAEGGSSWANETSKCADEGVGCMNCELLSSAVDNLVVFAKEAGDYYTNQFPQVVNGFVKTVAHWESVNTNPDTAIFPDVKVAYTPRPTMPKQPTPRLALAYAKPIADIPWKQIAKQFVTVVDDTPIPVVEHSLWWYLKYPLKPCEMQAMVYGSCKEPKYSTADAAALTVRVMAIFWGLGWLTTLSLPLVLQVPMAVFLFGIFRYDYVPRCLPLLPVCLMQDVQYMITAVTPPCLCQIVPALVVNSDQCTPQLCARATIVYAPCPERQLGLLWAPVYTLRWLAPALFDYLSEPFEFVDSIQDMRKDMELAVPLSDVDLTCAKISMLNVVTALLLLRVCAIAVALALRPMLQSTMGIVGNLMQTMPFLLKEVPRILHQDNVQQGSVWRGWT